MWAVLVGAILNEKLSTAGVADANRFGLETGKPAEAMLLALIGTTYGELFGILEVEGKDVGPYNGE